MRFSETRLERDDRRARLLDSDGRILLELTAHEIDDAIYTGFIDPDNWHYSMFEYAEIRRDVRPIIPSAARDFDSEFLARYNIRWD